MTFTDAETAYLASQRLGRLATIQPDGSPQVKPVGFRYNPGLGTIDVTGFNMTTSQKFRNVGPRLWSMTSPRPTRGACASWRSGAQPTRYRPPVDPQT